MSTESESQRIRDLERQMATLQTILESQNTKLDRISDQFETFNNFMISSKTGFGLLKFTLIVLSAAIGAGVLKLLNLVHDIKG